MKTIHSPTAATLAAALAAGLLVACQPAQEGRTAAAPPAERTSPSAMADKAADDGSGIWTSKANIARDLELSRRAVQLAIQELIRDGLVTETGQRDCKHGFTVEYSIVIEAVDNLPSTREPRSPRESDARVTREPGSHDPVNQIHPNHPYKDTTTPQPKMRLWITSTRRPAASPSPAPVSARHRAPRSPGPPR